MSFICDPHNPFEMHRVFAHDVEIIPNLRPGTLEVESYTFRVRATGGAQVTLPKSEVSSRMRGAAREHLNARKKANYGWIKSSDKLFPEVVRGHVV